MMSFRAGIFLCCLLVIVPGVTSLRSKNGVLGVHSKLQSKCLQTLTPNTIGSVRSQATNINPRFSSSIVCVRGGAISNLRNYVSSSKTRSWAVLFLAILADTMSTTIMKMAQDESSVVKLMVAYSGYFFSLSSFALALGALDVSIAYAVWAAMGTAIVSIVGVLFFKETCDIVKLGCLAMIVLGVVGLNLRH